MRPADRARVDSDASFAIDIVLRASSAFGTGEHATTQLCLEFLRERKLEGALRLSNRTQQMNERKISA